MFKFSNIAILLPSIILFMSGVIAHAGMNVDHTAWDIRKVAEVFRQSPEAVEIRYQRDLDGKPGAYEVKEKDGKVSRIEIPPMTSPVPVYVQTSYPKVYSRKDVEQLEQELANGDAKSLLREAHETAGLITRGKKVQYVIELTGIAYAGKSVGEKIKVVDKK